ncbi:MAG: class I mannose-6-phosphate isomerase [Marinilabiliales bacterium]|nr:class I mannose-6-phosphate isomerase [Marinilabiliales bacterium]
MNHLYPLKFKPIYKEKIWGGNNLQKLFGKQHSSPKLGECWEISGVQDDISVVSEGFLKGNNLEELIEVYMGELVGEKVYEKFGTEFPLLIKYIDANDRLSIQVHPDDKLAKERHGAYGKTEMWYVVHAEEGAQLISGFNKPVDKETYLLSLNHGRLENLMQFEPVKKGDTFFIPAGRVHAILKGIVVAEIQQTSDVTYRIYDFERVDEHGLSRELHTELALEAIDFKAAPEPIRNPSILLNESIELVKCDYFTTCRIDLNQLVERDFSEMDTFVIYLCLEGNCKLEWENGMVTMKTGETVLVPANIENFTLSPIDGPSARLLEVFLES